MLETIECELAIIGAGMSGMAATFFASERGIRTVQVGTSGSLSFASGLFDLLGVHPIEEKNRQTDPWIGIKALYHDLPGHPYVKTGEATLKTSFSELISFLESAGISYCHEENRNSEVLTSLGTTKPSYYVPQSMWWGVDAYQKKTPCLLVGFRGMKEFSSRQLETVLKEKWKDLRSVTMDFPGAENYLEVYPERLARSLDAGQTGKILAELIKKQVKDAKIIGLPAMLGVHKNREIMREMEEIIGIPIFEIPTLPVSVPGLRLKEAFENHLSNKGVRQLHSKKVLKGARVPGKGFELDIGAIEPEVRIKAAGVILASGRFLGGGLVADRTKVSETIFNLPVKQIAKRDQWHRYTFFDNQGHLLNQTGLDVDESFRPINEEGKQVHEDLFATGAILAHHDWMRMKCGSGVSVATAYAAVQAFIENSSQN
ncbi:glycerol-3-phosphate dehydrogenase subunit GlpB [bacterium]|nr:glycerol-3-phosphate dehydrogenase subunit GlpB [bacterium]